MQIASLFASLGFKVDTAGVDKFQASMKTIRAETALFAAHTKKLATNLRSMASGLDSVSSKLDKISLKKANANIAQSYTEVAKSVARVHTALNGIANNEKRITLSLDRINDSVRRGEPIWDRYRFSVVATKHALTDINNKMLQLRANSSVTLNARTNTGGYRGGYNQQGNQGGMGFMGGFGGRNEFAGGFFRSMLPAIATGSAIPAAGFALKEIVQRGRQQQKMENILLLSSKGLEDFADTLKYVQEESDRLGVRTKELGTAFAQINMSAEGKLSKEDKKKMFTNLSESFLAVGAEAPEQQLLFKAVNQMFSLGRIQAEEMNQLTGQGLVPRTFVYDAIKQVYNVKTNEEVAKLQKENKLDPAKVIPVFAEMFAKKARDSGALEKAMSSSQAQQQRFMNRLDRTSKMIMDAGLDKMLSKLFGLGTEFLGVVEKLIKAISTLNQGMKELTGGNQGLVLVLSILLGLLFKNRGALVQVAKGLGTAYGRSNALFLLLNNKLIGALITFGKRIFWIVAAYEVLTAVAKDVEKQLGGQATWIELWALQFELGYQKFMTFITKIKYAIAKFRHENGEMMNLFTFGETESDKALNRYINKNQRPKEKENKGKDEPSFLEKLKLNIDILNMRREALKQGRLGAYNNVPINNSQNKILGTIDILNNGRKVGTLEFDTLGSVNARTTVEILT